MLANGQERLDSFLVSHQTQLLQTQRSRASPPLRRELTERLSAPQRQSVIEQTDPQRRRGSSCLRQPHFKQPRIEARRPQLDVISRARVEDAVVSEDGAKSRDIAHQRSTSTIRRESVGPDDLYQSSDGEHSTRLDQQGAEHASLLRATQLQDFPVSADL